MGRRFLFSLLDAGEAIAWFIRDQFTTADPAPVATGRLAEPGPGTLTITDTENKFSIGGGPGVFALLESGDRALLETGDRHILDI